MSKRTTHFQTCKFRLSIDSKDLINDKFLLLDTVYIIKANTSDVSFSGNNSVFRQYCLKWNQNSTIFKSDLPLLTLSF